MTVRLLLFTQHTHLILTTSKKIQKKKKRLSCVFGNQI